MSNKFYRPGTDRAGGVQDLFAAVAPRYDLINDLQSFGWHRLWKRRMINLAEPSPGEHALDLCCGTGDIALALAAKGLKVTGLDFSEAMLAVAEHRRAAFAQNTRTTAGTELKFIQGDALEIPYPEDSFEIVTISYGLRNVSDWQRGLEEMRRVAKPEGRLLILDFGKPDTVWLRGAYFWYLRRVVPLFGRVFCGDSATHAYIHESLQNYPAQRGVDRKLREMGCADVSLVSLFGGIMSINFARKGEGQENL